MSEITQESAIIKIVDEAGLPDANKQVLIEHFKPFEIKIQEWMAIVENLVVTDVSQKAEIQQAKDALKLIVKVRTGIDDKHQELKANALKEGRLYDKIKNTLKDLLAPVEEHLKLQANFEKIQIENERKRIQSERAQLLSQYMDNADSMPLADMNQDAFDNLLSGQKLAYDSRIEAEKKAEQDRIEAEAKAAEEAEAQRLENIRLKAEAEEREKIFIKRGEELKPYLIMIRDYKSMLYMNEVDYQKELSEIKIGYQQHLEYEAKKKAENDAKEKELADLKAKREKEEAEEKARLAAEKKAQRAPDKQKLLTIVEKIESLQIEVAAIDFKDADAKKVSEGVVTLLEKIRVYVNENSSKL